MRFRTDSILIALVGLAAALQTSCAMAGYQPVGVGALIGGDMDLVSFAEAEAYSGFHHSSSSAGPVNSRDRNHPPVQDDELRTVNYSTESAGCGAQSPSHSGGSGSSPAAIPAGLAAVPKAIPIGLLPVEMGPSFSNPPPWTLLRPPRS